MQIANQPACIKRYCARQRLTNPLLPRKPDLISLMIMYLYHCFNTLYLMKIQASQQTRSHLGTIFVSRDYMFLIMRLQK